MEQIKLLRRTITAKNLLILAASIFIMVSSVAAARPIQDQESREREARQKKEQAEFDRQRAEMFREMTPEDREARMKLELRSRAKRQLELAKMAKLTMEQAIQIASTQKSGTAMECALIGERNTAFYRVTVVSGDEKEPVSSYVYVNAVDGTIGDFPNAGYAFTTGDGKGRVFTFANIP